MKTKINREDEPLMAPWREGRLARLARKIGRSKSHLSRVLRGERKPGRELAQVIRRLGIEIEEART